jgi:hypothetical protein
MIKRGNNKALSSVCTTTFCEEFSIPKGIESYKESMKKLVKFSLFIRVLPVVKDKISDVVSIRLCQFHANRQPDFRPLFTLLWSVVGSVELGVTRDMEQSRNLKRKRKEIMADKAASLADEDESSREWKTGANPEHSCL